MMNGPLRPPPSPGLAKARVRSREKPIRTFMHPYLPPAAQAFGLRRKANQQPGLIWPLAPPGGPRPCVMQHDATRCQVRWGGIWMESQGEPAAALVSIHRLSLSLSQGGRIQDLARSGCFAGPSGIITPRCGMGAHGSVLLPPPGRCAARVRPSSGRLGQAHAW